MKLNSLTELLQAELKDLYSAESQLLKALPKMAKGATSDELRTAFEEHLGQTRGQLERLEQVGEMLGLKLTGKKCHAMEGLIEEGKEILQAEGEPAALDAALIAAAQKVEHYEIAGYGTARTLARQLGEEEAARLLQETLDEESATDERLTRISEGEVLPQLAEAGIQQEGDGSAGGKKKTRARASKR